MVHIVGHWTWPSETGQKHRVRVYSNCDSVELFPNDKSLGVRQPAATEHVWKDFHDRTMRRVILSAAKDPGICGIK